MLEIHIPNTLITPLVFLLTGRNVALFEEFFRGVFAVL